ncbi:MAG: MotA/TolQ/ExbB proton channel family protein [Lachnospiraceae bacterium]|nr:MotA/TolQ/ExbB proton channel family protein [Lachnospiraceae bacterium]
MDIATLGGLLLGVVMVVFGIVSGAGVSALGNFVDVPSVIITIGGSLSSCLFTRKMPEFIGGFTSFGKAMNEPQPNDPVEIITQIMAMANVARKEGLLALEEQGRNLEDEFLRKGIMLVVDGTEADLVRGILENDMDNTSERHKAVAGFWEKWAEAGPAWGMIGTLIGLVNMLQNMSDPSSIGPSMAVALLTTLYGSLIANWLAGPTAMKLKENDGIEMLIKQVSIEGLLSIQAGENPRVIEEKLKTFMAPSAREAVSSEGGE